MKRILLFLCLGLSLHFSSQAQSLMDTTSKNYYGVHLISNWSLPVYFSFTKLNPHWHSYGVKAGLFRGKEYGTVYTTYPYSTSNQKSSDYEQRSFFAFVTPVYIPKVFRQDGKLYYFSLGAPFGYSNDHLVKTYNNDVLLGNYSTEFYEQHIYQAIELGFAYWIDLGKNLSFSMGANTGLRLLKPIPFKEQFNDLNTNHTYFPGTSKGLYFSIHLGILFSKFKK
ncbi:MAG: hypothetical protein K9I36_07700 [Bacteroidia bacterium]|nr:hypothetical protein [Bacteroidia bacterium]